MLRLPQSSPSWGWVFKAPLLLLHAGRALFTLLPISSLPGVRGGVFTAEEWRLSG